MEFGRICLMAFGAVAVCACSGCSETSGYVDYATLNAVAPDFQAGVNPAYQVGAAELPPTTESRAVAQEEAGDESSVANTEPSTSVVADETQKDVIDDATPAVAREASVDDSTEPEDANTESRTKERSLPGTDPLAIQKPTGPREIKLLVPEKRFRTEGENSVRVSYDDIDLLKILNMEPVRVDAPSHFPDWLKQLDGQRIRVRGYMYPTFEATGLRGFTLARDNGICCFVRQPMVYDIIGVDLAEGVTTDYIDNRPFDVEGVFQIAPEADDTELFQLYRITDAKVLN